MDQLKDSYVRMLKLKEEQELKESKIREIELTYYSTSEPSKTEEK